MDEDETECTDVQRLATIAMFEYLAHCGDLNRRHYTSGTESTGTANDHKNKNVTLTSPTKMHWETPNGNFVTETFDEKENTKEHHNDTEDDTGIPNIATTEWINVLYGIYQCLDRLKQIREDFFDTEAHEYDDSDQIPDERGPVIDHEKVMHGQLDVPTHDKLTGSNSNYMNDMCFQTQQTTTRRLFTDNIYMYSESEPSTTSVSDYDDTLEQTAIFLMEIDGLDNYAFNYESDKDKISPTNSKTERCYKNILGYMNDNRERLSATYMTQHFSRDASLELEDNCNDVNTYCDEDEFVGNNDNDDTDDNGNDDGLCIDSDVNEDFSINFKLASIQRTSKRVGKRYEFKRPNIGKSFTDINETKTLRPINGGQVSLTSNCYECVEEFPCTYNTFNCGPISQPTCQRLWAYIPELNDAPLDNYTDCTTSVELNESSDNDEYMLGVEKDYYEDATIIVEKWCEEVDNAGRCNSIWMTILNDAISALDTEYSESDFRYGDDANDDCHEKEEGKDGYLDDYMKDIETFYDGDDEDGESLLDDRNCIHGHNDANVKEPEIVRRAQTAKESAIHAFKYNETRGSTGKRSRYDDGSSDELNINAATQRAYQMASDNLGGKAGHTDKMEPDNESSASEEERNREVFKVDDQCDKIDIVYRTVVKKCNTYNNNDDIKHLPMSVYNSVVNVYNFVEAEMLRNKICAGVKEDSQERIDILKEDFVEDEECIYHEACEMDMTLERDMYQEDTLLYNSPATGSETEGDIDDEIDVNTVVEEDARSQDEQYQLCCFPIVLLIKKPREMQTATTDRQAQVGNRKSKHNVGIQANQDFKTHAKRPRWVSRISQVMRHSKKSKR